jgi:hypothetical protein
MIDLKFNPKTRDLVIPVVPVDGAERAAQSVGIRLRCWLGEWFLDTTHGVPYVENILKKNVRPEIVEAILRSQILQVKGVKSIKSFTLQTDPHTRKSSITFSAETVEGLISLNSAL